MCHGSAWSFTCLSKIPLSIGFKAFANSKYNVCYTFSSNLHVHLQLYNFLKFILPYFLLFFLFSFATRRLLGESSFHLQLIQKFPLEGIIFLDGIDLKTENLPFKPMVDDQSVLRYWCICYYMYFHTLHKVDGEGFSFKYQHWLRNQISPRAQKGVKCRLMTGLKGSTDFSFPHGNPRQSRGKYLGMRENKTQCFPWGQSLKQSYSLDDCWHQNFPCFQCA